MADQSREHMRIVAHEVEYMLSESLARQVGFISTRQTAEGRFFSVSEIEECDLATRAIVQGYFPEDLRDQVIFRVTGPFRPL